MYVCWMLSRPLKYRYLHWLLLINATLMTDCPFIDCISILYPTSYRVQILTMSDFSSSVKLLCMGTLNCKNNLICQGHMRSDKIGFWEGFNIGYPSENYLKLKYRDISFVHNSQFRPVVLKCFTEHDSHDPVKIKISNRLGNCEIH